MSGRGQIKSCRNRIYPFDDYNKYAMAYFDGQKRLKRREPVFVEDCKKAFELGKKMC
jgi:hypothetical protein